MVALSRACPGTRLWSIPLKTNLTIVRLVREYASILSNASALTASRILFFAAIADIRRFCSTLAEPLLERIPALCQMNSSFFIPSQKHAICRIFQP
jgi:hypothetical protein